MRSLLLLSVLLVSLPAFSAPVAPGNVVAYAPNQSQVHVSWEDNSTDETGFEVQINVNGGGWTPVGTLPANFQVYRGAALSTAEGTYQFQVRSIKGAEQSEFAQSSQILKPTGPLDLLVNPNGGIEIPEGIGTRVGQALSFQIRVFNGSPTSYISSSLPAGLSLNATTGVITNAAPYAAPDTSKVHRIFVGVEFDGGKRFEHVRFIRVLPAASTPVVANPITLPKQQLGVNGFLSVGDLFVDPARPLGAWFYTGGQSIIVALYDTATPKTVGNFLSYAVGRAYDGSYVHRSIPGFIFQGGGYGPASATATPTQWAAVQKAPSVANEPGISNTRGTISMAKTPGVRDGASSEWFFNVGTTNPANLDFQNGGFTAFGAVVGTTGMSTVDAIANLYTGDYQISVTGQGGGLFQDIPVLDPVTGPLSTLEAPASLTANSLLRVDSVSFVSPVVITLVGNSSPGVLDAGVIGPLLYIESKNVIGSTSLTLRATNLDGNSVDFTLPIRIDDLVGPALRLTKLRGVNPPGTVLVKGRATDKIGLGSWRYRINKKGWRSGGRLKGTSAALSKKLTGFKRGKNLIEIEVFDARKNSSGVLKQTLTFS